MATSPSFVGSPNVGVTTFTNSDGTSAKTIFSPGSSGSRVSNIQVATDNSAAITVVLSLYASSTEYKLDYTSLALSLIHI